ncbi:MAG TPA: translation factor GTPase family protein [Actinocrinis sp.]|uniref:translation factor GTPase family protein n=1 Tax=Actinocrinis sp. TaxID=1920516 RepID=UPI002DDC92DC|nr:translation factor GTPase family protein [Actinocrinis sp.]HEV3172615.1 translation factor GTPase family protein [Actinocrinis sp.]
MKSLNLGILAHVDAGKTSLTERLLHAAGVIDELGSVDDGNTQTDSLALERERGITIKSAVVSFALGDVAVNLIDTPGHPDFIAEVERVLNVLDGAVLVVSAVEGVQAQTRVLMRVLQRLRIPTLVFVNKIDRAGAQYDLTLRAVSEKLSPAVIAMGTASGLGTQAASFDAFQFGDREFRSRLTELLAENDDAILAAYLDTTIRDDKLFAALKSQTGRALVHPMYFGSAITGAGVDALAAGIRDLLPPAPGDTDAPPAGTVFKVERGPAGEKIAYARMFAGTVRVRDRLRLRGGAEEKVTAINVFEHGSAVRRDAVLAGQIAKLWGLGDIRIGDPIGLPEGAAPESHFAPPTLETVVVPGQPSEKGSLHAALAQFAEQDPLIGLRQDEIRQEISVSLYGEVQKEVIQATLKDEFDLDVTFRETTTVYIERPTGIGTAFEKGGKDKDVNPFLATVGLRVDPAPVGAGIEFRLEVELGAMPYAFFKAVEDTVTETLQQGLYGWRVADCVVTMTHCGYWPRQSHAHQKFDKSMSSTGADFRGLTPLVLMSALKEAGTVVCEPMHRFRLDLPADTVAAVLPVLARLGAVPLTQTLEREVCLIEGEIPAAQVHALERQLPSLTRGEGALESAFDHYQPVRGEFPTRPRWDHNPLNRKEYLLHVQRRVSR